MPQKSGQGQRSFARNTPRKRPLRETKIRRSTFPPPHHAAPAASCGLVLLRRSHKRNRMVWARMLAYITGTVDQELLLRNEYLAAENRILKAQIKGRLLL